MADNSSVMGTWVHIVDEEKTDYTSEAFVNEGWKWPERYVVGQGLKTEVNEYGREVFLKK